MCATTMTLMDKESVRMHAKKVRSLLTKEEQIQRSLEVMNLLMKHELFMKASKIGIYYPLKNEIDLTPLIEKFPNKMFYFPKTVGNTLTFSKVQNVEELVPGRFGLKEPKEGLYVEKDIDVYLVPCLATSGLYRIGYGAGYYDQYFNTAKGYKIGITYNELKNYHVKFSHFDIPMDEII